jgi:hypothetical protein
MCRRPPGMLPGARRSAGFLDTPDAEFPVVPAWPRATRLQPSQLRMTRSLRIELLQARVIHNRGTMRGHRLN